ncbi:1-phosphofructokinase family hexose kinase [Streptomyces sp. AV19]|uniref:1-phosphofructokinase family hexose kinase n=1 Tax=Streptomyces sp. AV19 TaxID=2793068 RepID=UPI0018FEE5AF|nr:1-phosphofructokinase family hexose kinase [Streptomyces sp. AV19]MBH1936093.1 1-phosphofructokinase family hexose kinase [Streptomyces sp. AV19]MDG4534112.1 1-phosphofructokinase family hexose kinase [Streptomyces sp. AV19]
MILTVTLNAALDLTYRVPRLRPHTAHRVTDAVERPGGKGLNVARVLARLGHAATVTGFAGGPTGETLRRLLSDTSPALTDALVPVTGSTRRTVAVVDAATGDTTQLNEPGPQITPAEWSAFTTRYDRLLDGAGAVALCGSLPPGVPVGAYAHLIRQARARRIPVLLDTDGEPLRRGIAARPDVVKPNAVELAALTGSTEPLRAALDARRRGAHAVAATLGPDGMLVVTPDGTWRATPPARVKGNPTGAGDSAVAGLLSAWLEGLPWPDRLTRAVALSAATVRAATAGEYDEGAYEAALPLVKAVPLGGS